MSVSWFLAMDRAIERVHDAAYLSARGSITASFRETRIESGLCQDLSELAMSDSIKKNGATLIRLRIHSLETRSAVDRP